MSNLNTLLTRASKVGTYAASLEVDHQRGTKDQIHHVGDDTGRIVTEAYREFGAEAAAQVVDEYLAAFNVARNDASIREVTPNEAIKNLSWAIPSNTLTETQIAEITAVFQALYGTS